MNRRIILFLRRIGALILHFCTMHWLGTTNSNGRKKDPVARCDCLKFLVFFSVPNSAEAADSFEGLRVRL